MRSPPWTVGCVLVAVLFAAGCHRQGRASDEPERAQAASGDTLRGMLSVVGSEPLSQLILTPISGEPVGVAGADERRLRRLPGLVVMVAGRFSAQRAPAMGSRTMRVFDVDSFVVRSADGVATHDGILALDGGRYYLVTAGRTLSADHLPVSLRQMVGARVFLAGDLDRAPVSYGVISER